MTLTATRYAQQKIDTSVSYTTKRKGEWDLRDFGAVGDSDLTSGNGTNNDTAFAAAEAKIGNDGFGRLVIPGGNFRYTTSRFIDSETGLQNMSIIGLGQQTSALYFDNFNGDAITWGSSVTPGGGSAQAMTGTFRDFSLHGRGNGTNYVAGSVGVHCVMSAYWRMERLLIFDFESGVYLDGYHKFTSGGLLDQLRVFGARYGYKTGSTFDGDSSGGSQDVTDITFWKCYTNEGAYNGNLGASIGFYLQRLNTSALMHCSAEAFDRNWQLGRVGSSQGSSKNVIIQPRGEGADVEDGVFIEADNGQGNHIFGNVNVTDSTATKYTNLFTNWDTGGTSEPRVFKVYPSGGSPAGRPSTGGTRNGAVGMQLGTAGTVPDALWFHHMLEDGTYAWQTLNVPVITGHAPTDADFPTTPGPGSQIFRTDLGSGGNGTLYVRGTAANSFTALN